MILEFLTNMGLNNFVYRDNNIEAFDKYKINQLCLYEQKVRALYPERKASYTLMRMLSCLQSRHKYFYIYFLKLIHKTN